LQRFKDIHQVITFLGITLLGAVIIGLIKCAKKDVQDTLDGFYKSLSDDNNGDL
jgi:hypothetical protein